MAIQSADIAVTNVQKYLLGGGRKQYFATLSFNGGKTYDTGGVSLPKGRMGITSKIRSLEVLGSLGAAYVYQFSTPDEKLKFFVAGISTDSSSVDANSLGSTQSGPSVDVYPTLTQGAARSGMGLISADLSMSYRFPTLFEVATGDTLTGVTADVIYYGH